jgi:hypothetical protein
MNAPDFDAIRRGIKQALDELPPDEIEGVELYRLRRRLLELEVSVMGLKARWPRVAAKAKQKPRRPLR